MDTIDRETLGTLARHAGWPSVSIYQSTHRTITEKDQDRIALKNHLAVATARLVADGMRGPDADALLSDATGLLTDNRFWRETSDGLAIFVERGMTDIYVVDTPMPEEVVVGDRFHLRPLALAHHGDERFYALVLDRNATRLFTGDRAMIREIPIVGAATSLAESAQYDSREESLQYSTHASPESVTGTGRAFGMFHGHGGENVDKTELTRFASDLEREVTRLIGAEKHIPLVLMGVEYQLAAYRSVNTYPSLAGEQVLGATDELTEAAIHKLAIDALEPRYEAARQADLTELHELPSALVTDDPVEIVSAAATGRVKSLFFDEALGPYGHLDRDMLEVTTYSDASPRYLRDSAEPSVAPELAGWDLVDLALAETVLHGGEVHAFIGEDAPVRGVAAVLRY